MVFTIANCINISVCLTCRITVIDRIIPTVGKHIVAQNALAGGSVGVCVDESAYLRIVITGLEIVERGLSVLELAGT